MLTMLEVRYLAVRLLAAIGICLLPFLALGACAAPMLLICSRETSNPELRKAPQLVEQGALIGLSREEVVGRLGEPNDGKILAEWDAAYWLRPDDSLVCVDSKWLAINFGEDGRVERAAITND
jgi:hypothetical protein